MITSLLSDMLNKTAKKKFLQIIWLQNFDPTLQNYRLDNSIYGPDVILLFVTLSIWQQQQMKIQ